MSMKDIIFSIILEKLEEKTTNPYAIGMAAAMKSTGDEPPLKKSTITKAHKIAKGIKKNEEADLDEENNTHVYLNPLKGNADPKKVAVIKGRVTNKHLDDLAKKHNASREDFEWGNDKWNAGVTNEEVEQIDELSKKTLGSYIKKASDTYHPKSVASLSGDAERDWVGGKHDQSYEKAGKAEKRASGISKAVNCLTKEEAELDEKKTLSAKDIKNALSNVKAQPKEKVTLKKVPWNEEVELDEQTMPGNVALRLADRHYNAATYHKQNRNMKGYAAHMKHGSDIEDAVIRAGRDMPVRSARIESKSDKLFKEHPLRVVKEEVEEFDEAVNAKKVIADHDAGHSVDVIVQKHLNKKADNKDEILKIIRNNAWNKRIKK